jgi:hypothetical protein
MRTVYFHNDMNTECAVMNDYPFNSKEEDIPEVEEIL